MRILHTSDWHLGQNFYSKSREAEHQAFLDWLLETAQAHQVDAIIVAGDVFDTGSPPSYARTSRREATSAGTTVLLSIYSKLAVIWWYWQETMTRSPR